MDLLDRLLDHDDWATTTLLNLSRPLTDAQLDQEFDIGHRTLRETYTHMVSSAEYWTSVMSGQPREAQSDVYSVAALMDFHRRTYATFAAFARRMRDEQRLDDASVDHFGGPMTLGGAILHVVLHDEGHRIEALHILQRLGVADDLLEIDHGLWDYTRRGF